MNGDQEEQYEARYSGGTACYGAKAEDWKDVAGEFMREAGEMSMEFGKGCRDIVLQSLVREDSYLVRNFGKDSYIGWRIIGTRGKVFWRLKLFNEYLELEDKVPVDAWLDSLGLLVSENMDYEFLDLKASLLEEIGVSHVDLPASFGWQDTQVVLFMLGLLLDRFLKELQVQQCLLQ
ncbi:hypothetical protein SLEP1_g3712 [Rubroshorea leprosula]|uniref:Uncharacterized protein n=1 Tax=Rubroshorea leprosula TaxID=152421 RepID=A0AAV5HWT2_9ROSI|nr:hypothetical protein SLEP1_g3712 [Rubroshorea leprosula]